MKALRPREPTCPSNSKCLGRVSEHPVASDWSFGRSGGRRLSSSCKISCEVLFCLQMTCQTRRWLMRLLFGHRKTCPNQRTCHWPIDVLLVSPHVEFLDGTERAGYEAMATTWRLIVAQSVWWNCKLATPPSWSQDTSHDTRNQARSSAMRK